MDFLDSLSPRTTSVNQAKKELGRAAGEFLMDILIENAAYNSKSQKFTPEIIERQSVLDIN
jgi:DNA-binding LacI/PurR family transcriptional regulator